MNYQQIEAIMRLFKGYIQDIDDVWQIETDRDNFLANALSKGIMFTEVNKQIPGPAVEYAFQLYGKKPEEWNKTFHKSISTVMETPLEILVVQQIVHYITTYGFEELGIFDNDTVYFPKEKLEIPDLEGEIPLVVIKPITIDELKERIMTLITSGIALSKETINDIMILSDYIDLERVDDVTNTEVKISLYQKYNIVPGNNVEFLRYIIKQLTGETLLIKNEELENKIKEIDNEKLYKYLRDYVKRTFIVNGETITGYEKLSEIYNRFKPLFISMKRPDKRYKYAKEINNIINIIMRKSKKHHKPLKHDILAQLSQLGLTVGIVYNEKVLLKALDKITTFREIRILNSLKYRQFQESKAFVYKIRNGKAFAENNLAVTRKESKLFKTVYNTIANHLAKRIKKNIEGKTVYIPKDFVYMAPTSEKQFNGNFPEGSYVEIPRTKNMLIGVHWYNLPEKFNIGYAGNRVDLDLKAQNKYESYGWNASYRSRKNEIVFSGDVTQPDPEKGATEVIYISRQIEEKTFLMTLNKYTSNKAEVPYEIIIASTDDESVRKNYVINPNDVIITIQDKFNYTPANDEYGSLDKTENDKTLGLVQITKDTIRWYFNDFSTGSSIVTKQDNVKQIIYNYLNEYPKYQIQLGALLKYCGAVITDKPEIEIVKYLEKLEDNSFEEINQERAEELKKSGNGHLVFENKVLKPVDINLSYQSISKDTIIKILSD